MNVTQSSSLNVQNDRGEAAAILGCRSSLGGYFLPKSYLTFQISAQTTSDGSKTDYILQNLDTTVLPDTRRGYCLDYLASAFADDQVTVRRSSTTAASQQLLETVSSSAIDQTAIIIRKIIRTAFTALSNSGFRDTTNKTPPPAEPVADLAYDPFNQVESAAINDRIRAFGFCIVMESYTFGDSRHAAVQQYCNNPRAALKRKSAFAEHYAAYEKADIPSRTFGILYRPRATYELSIYAKDNPKGSGPWLLRHTKPVILENISPVLSIKIDRALFTEKQIGLAFDRGDLKDVCIFKKSELVEAVKIPLEVAKSIVALPTQVLQIQYDQISQSKALVKAETDVLAAQQQTLQLLANPGSAPNIPDSSPPRFVEEPTTPPNVSIGDIESLTRTTIPDMSACGGTPDTAVGSAASARTN